ncbi:uncharacterized protein F5Z01DRAFT_656557 [Emericellopsis atlantica]|uniref:Peroxin 20 n=1 Tax=Emericellopsis atlantica TaxID=2614577 RepID=A0A9P7ZKK9_9HYPO|nr:uncharacterized protein F5Z01DRAFT_656557 [Emericellopsis atlantica]KAG9253720.1 hypothetical protein F5Z01DRAFT_656557 [Emericellopsis atlantica]
MAEASCSGPSPFKSLVDHHQRNTSHHQDRFVNNTPAGQSFRSQQAQGPSSQNDFAAFMDGASQLSGPPPHHAAARLANHAAALEPHQHHHQPHFAQPQQQQPPAGMGGWAADFARFAQQSQPQQHHQPHPQQQHQQQPMPQQPMFHPQRMAGAFGFQNQQSPLYGPTNSGFLDPQVAHAQRPAAEADFDTEMSKWMSQHGSSTAQNAKAMEDVDAVMEQMARALEVTENAVQEQDELAQAQGPQLTDLRREEIGHLQSSTPPSEQETTAAEAAKGRSEVSEAAERLLDSVRHEDGDKWKNSIFLSLMRDFRDGKKDIVGDEIRETEEEEVVSRTS